MAKQPPISLIEPPDDARFMQLALAEAGLGAGQTRPNPPVGAVLVRRGEVLGRGYHHRAGAPHAEIEALQVAPGEVRGATLYVTLEPCDHQGRTGPCSQALVEAGIARVVVGCIDPNAQVRGRGVKRLRRAGIQVELGVCEREARELIAAYAKHVVTGLPLVILKAATSLDGRLATRSGDSAGLTGTEAHAHLHALRAQCDAILVGVNTVRADNPRLTPREANADGAENKLVRVVVDSQARTSPRAKVVRGEGSVIIATIAAAPESRIRKLEKAGAEVLVCRSKAGRVSLTELFRRLGDRGLMSVLVEGGGEVHGSLLRERLVDRVKIYVAPRLIGGDGVPLLGGKGKARLAATGLIEPRWQALGEDMLLTARL